MIRNGHILFVVFTSGLDGFRPIKLLQHHDTSQVMGESHGTHGKPEIRFFFYPGRHPKGGTDEKTGAAFAGKLYCLHFICQLLGRQ